MATALNDVYEPQYNPAVGMMLDAGYRPCAREEFMSPLQLAYFRKNLLDWKEAIVSESRYTMAKLKSGPIRQAAVTDRASRGTDWGIVLRTPHRTPTVLPHLAPAPRRAAQ